VKILMIITLVVAPHMAHCTWDIVRICHCVVTRMRTRTTAPMHALPTHAARVREALDGLVPSSQTADYGYAHEKATFDTPICGQRTETMTVMPPHECMVLHMGPGHDAAWMI